MHTAAKFYHSLGANVVPGNGKKANLAEWKQYTTERQASIEVFDCWHRATGLAIVNGIGDFRSIDFDDVTDIEIIYKALDLLQLPRDYPWLVRSGSGTGFHIWIRAAFDLPFPFSDDSVIKLPSKSGEFDHLELRWKDCVTAAPPTKHNDTHWLYRWVNNDPTDGPEYVTSGAIQNLIEQITDPTEALRRKQEDAKVRAKLATDVKNSTGDKDSDHLDKIKEWIDENYLEIAESTIGFDDIAYTRGGTKLGGNGGLFYLQGCGFYRFDCRIGGDAIHFYDYCHNPNNWSKEAANTRFKYTLQQLSKASGVIIPQQYSCKRLTLRDAIKEVTPEISGGLIKLAPTDAGNAERLQLLFGENIRYNHTTDQWVIWNGLRWQVDSTGQIDLIAVDTARAVQHAVLDTVEDTNQRAAAMKWAMQLENVKPRKNMIISAQALPGIATTIDLYDNDKMLLGVQNGTIDLHTCTFREARQADYITRLAGVEYDPNADCPRWKQFISEVFANDKEMIAYIQRAIGYTLTGDTREQVMFLAYGTGSNGKSTMFHIIQRLLGDYADTTGFSTFDADSRSEQTNDLAKLKGARFVSIAETDEDKRLNEAKVKASTGEDLISCRFLHKEFFSYRPQFKIWLMVNHKPVIRGTDNGIWRRLQTIPFTQSFKGREDKTLKETLEVELPGILNWALEGLQEWHKQGLNTPDAIKTAAAQYRHENDVIAQWLDECCRVEPDAYVTTENAYTSYQGWCKVNGHSFVLTKTKFSQRLADKGYSVQQKRTGGFGSSSKNQRVYVGFTTVS